MFVSGFFVIPSIKKGKKKFFIGKVSNIIWPFIIWSPIYYYMWMKIGALPKVDNLIFFSIKLIFSPILHLWFLQNILIFFVISWLLFNKYQTSSRLIFCSFAIAAPMLIAGSLPIDRILDYFNYDLQLSINNIEKLSHRVSRFGTLLLFFNTGIAAYMIGAEKIEKLIKEKSSIIAIFTTATVILIAHELFLEKYSMDAIIPSFVGVIGFISISISIERVNLLKDILIYIGNRSLEIYVIHMAVIMIAKKLVFSNEYFIGYYAISELSIISIVICLIVVAISRKFTNNILFSLDYFVKNKTRD